MRELWDIENQQGAVETVLNLLGEWVGNCCYLCIVVYSLFTYSDNSNIQQLCSVAYTYKLDVTNKRFKFCCTLYLRLALHPAVKLTLEFSSACINYCDSYVQLTLLPTLANKAPERVKYCTVNSQATWFIFVLRKVRSISSCSTLYSLIIDSLLLS